MDMEWDQQEDQDIYNSEKKGHINGNIRLFKIWSFRFNRK